MNDQQQTHWTPEPGDRYVSVWPHTLGEFEKFPNAVATVQPNGALVVTRWGASGSVPLKIYAPGYWATVEHVGDFAAPPAAAPRMAAERHPIEMTNYLVQAQNDETPAERTSEIEPVPADPFEKLNPEALDAENGDVNHLSGVGTIPPRPRPEEVVSDDPKAEEGGTPGSPDTSESVARFIFGDLLDRLPSWRRVVSWLPSRGGRAEPTLGRTPTHLLSVVRPELRTALLALAVSLPLLVLVLTTR